MCLPRPGLRSVPPWLFKTVSIGKLFQSLPSADIFNQADGESRYKINANASILEMFSRFQTDFSFQTIENKCFKLRFPTGQNQFVSNQNVII